MNKDAVRVNQIDLPAVFPSIRLLESFRAAWSIQCLMAAAFVYSGFKAGFDESFVNESLKITPARSPFVPATIAKLIFGVQTIFMQGVFRELEVFAILILRMLCLGFGAVGIARFAALMVSGNERSGMLRTVRLVVGSWKPIFVSTSLALAIGLVGLLLFRTTGHFAAWMSAAPDAVTLSNIVFWLCSLGTMVGLYVVLAGWLLGLSAIAVDRVDGAEALSRGISYVLSRFRRTSCYLIFIGLIADTAGQVTSWAVTVSGGVALRSIRQGLQESGPLSGGFESFRTGVVECVQLSAFCCGLAIAYLILRKMIDNVDHREFGDRN